MAKDQIKTLAFDDLDIDELERRLELATMMAASRWCASDCAVDCSSVCEQFFTCNPNLLR